MITGLSIRNFKVLAAIPETEGQLVGFGPLNVLIGPNGCGKSSLLQAIDFLRAFFMTSVEVYLKERDWEYRDLPNLRQTRKSIRWELKAKLDRNEEGIGEGEYHYVVTLQPRKHLGVHEEHLTWTPSNGEPTVLLRRKGRKCGYLDRVSGTFEELEIIGLPASVMSRWETQRDRQKFPELLRFRDWVEGFRSYLIWDPKALRLPSRGQDELGTSGEYLASVVGRLKDKNREAFRRFNKRLKRLFPVLSGISVSGTGWGWRHLHQHEGDGQEVAFGSRHMSDGVLRLLAVTSLLYVERPPTVITFEEPENGVHPQLIREVVHLLRELTERKPPNRCQVFFSTHSPYVLDEFYDHPDEVYCIERSRPRVGARIIRLSENKQLKIARDTFRRSLGEAWASGLLGATAGVRGL